MSARDSGSSGENGRRVLKIDRSPHLFRPLTVRSVTLRNKIMMSPMCQYSADDGEANDWHYVHLSSRAVGGAGIVCTEVIHTEPEGRITPHCLGLWNDDQRDGLARITEFITKQGAAPAIQIGHAGRKASVGRPWDGSTPLTENESGWPVVAPSPLPYADGWPIPRELDTSDIARLVEGFSATARRAQEAGFQILEIHAAHGYLINEFMSPLSNQREDDYGGSFDNRTRLLFEIIGAIRSEWPSDLPLFLRISASEWAEGGWTLEDSIKLGHLIKEQGEVDLIDCSSGGNDPHQEIPIHPGYQIPFAREIRKQTGLMTGAVGLINSPDMAETTIANGDADILILGRTMLANPYWPLHTAASLKAENVVWPVQYERAKFF